MQSIGTRTRVAFPNFASNQTSFQPEKLRQVGQSWDFGSTGTHNNAASDHKAFWHTRIDQRSVEACSDSVLLRRTSEGYLQLYAFSLLELLLGIRAVCSSLGQQSILKTTVQMLPTLWLHNHGTCQIRRISSLDIAKCL